MGQFGDNLKNVVKQTAERDGVGTSILIESGTVGGASKFLYNEYAKNLIGYMTAQSEPIGSKVDRATPFKNAILDGKIHVAITNDVLRGELIKQLKAFPLGKHEDIVDACAYAYNWLNKFNGGSIIKTGRIKPHKNFGVSTTHPLFR